jgi:hypothetical protein
MRSFLLVFALVGLAWLVAAGIKAVRGVAHDMRDFDGDAVCERCDQRREHPHAFFFAVVMPPAGDNR